MNSLNGLILIFMGGGLGSVLRYLMAIGVGKKLGEVFPYGTLAVNVLGCFLAGFIIQTFTTKYQITPDLRGFLIAGFLGGFTTFSAFTIDTYRLIDTGFTASAVMYVVLSVVLTIGACLAGVYGARGLIG